MTSKATSNYDRVETLGVRMAAELSVKRPSDALDWAKTEMIWRQLDTRLARIHGYDVFSGYLDVDCPILLNDLRRRLHFWGAALQIGSYQRMLGDNGPHELQSAAVHVAHDDRVVLYRKGLSYGDSWKKRGGVGAFMMLARKWDRIDTLLASSNASGQELLTLLQTNPGDVQDDVADLRRYLLLVLDEAIERGNVDG